MVDKHTMQCVLGESDWRVARPVSVSHPTTWVRGPRANNMTLTVLLQAPTHSHLSVCWPVYFLGPWELITCNTSKLDAPRTSGWEWGKWWRCNVKGSLTVLKSKSDNSATLLSLLAFFVSLFWISQYILCQSHCSVLSPNPVSSHSRLLFSAKRRWWTHWTLPAQQVHMTSEWLALTNWAKLAAIF